jgi:hypothetical protein
MQGAAYGQGKTLKYRRVSTRSSTLKSTGYRIIAMSSSSTRTDVSEDLAFQSTTAQVSQSPLENSGSLSSPPIDVSNLTLEMSTSQPELIDQHKESSSIDNLYESIEQCMTKYLAINLRAYEIRLVYLLPSNKRGATIQCRLVLANLGPDLIYEALSYKWGPILPEHQILLSGCRFNIRKNLWQALRQLRRKREERILWIDALCINQANVLERNHQVAQMGRIYSGYLRCVAWEELGEQVNRL